MAIREDGCLYCHERALNLKKKTLSLKTSGYGPVGLHHLEDGWLLEGFKRMLGPRHQDFAGFEAFGLPGDRALFLSGRA